MSLYNLTKESKAASLSKKRFRAWEADFMQRFRAAVVAASHDESALEGLAEMLFERVMVDRSDTQLLREAEKTFRLLVRKDPTAAKLFNLSCILSLPYFDETSPSGLSDMPPALGNQLVEYLRLAHNLDPEDDDIIANLCNALRGQGRVEELNTLARDYGLVFEGETEDMAEDRRAAEVRRKSAEKDVAKAKSLMDRKQWTKADGILKRVVEEGGSSHPYAWLFLGVCNYQLAQGPSPAAEPLFRFRVATSEGAFRQALKLDASLIKARTKLGLHLPSLRWQYKEAEKCFKMVLKLDPRHPDARRYVKMARDGAARQAAGGRG